MLIWLFFRIFSVALLVGSLAFFLSNLDSFVSNQAQILDLRNSLQSLEEIIAEENMVGDSNVSDLRKEISLKRREKEALLENGTADKEELSFLEPKLVKIIEQIKKEEEIVEGEKTNLSKSNDLIEQTKQQLTPLEDRKSELLAIQSQEKQNMNKVSEEWAIVDANFSSLKRVRETATETYSVSFGSVEESIVRPKCLFYGDKIDIEIESVSPNKYEFYTKQGLLSGIEKGFVFIVKSDEQWSEMPFYVTCTLSRENYSIFETDTSTSNDLRTIIAPLQNLQLIRSGEFSNRTDEEMSLGI